MAENEESPTKGLFGYEGEGFDIDGEDAPDTKPRDRSAERGWNIGREDDAPSTEGPAAEKAGHTTKARKTRLEEH